MGPGRMQAGLLQFLPIAGVFCATWAASANAQESFPNELNSPVDEPQVIVREHNDKVPVRQASRGIQDSKDPLVKLAWETREVTRRRLLSTAQHTPWQMMHGLLGLRQDFLISHNGEAINGLEWIRTGPMYQNEPWFQKTQYGGRAHPYNKPYWFEGHINQSLAILSQCEVPLDATFGTPNGPITMRDMLKNAQMTVNEKEEVTWTLWALCTYLPPDAKWVNAKGEQWSIERLVQVEVGKPVGGPTSPCGGTHGLYALARARNIYLATGKPLRGVWYQADQKIRKYIQISKTNQNANGTLSSAFFKGKEFKQDFDKRMASTGHQLEFLMMALDDRQLKEPWVRRAIEATANDLMANRKEYVSCSPLYHATNALTLFLERSVPSERQQNIAQRPSAKTISNSKDVTATQPPQAGPGSVPPVPRPSVVTTPATVQSMTPSAPKAGTNRATVAVQTPPATSPPVPVIGPALKQTPATSAIAADSPASVKSPDQPVSAESETKSGTAAKETVENPLVPVPLPDLTIPLPDTATDAAGHDSSGPGSQGAGVQTSEEAAPKASSDSPVGQGKDDSPAVPSGETLMIPGATSTEAATPSTSSAALSKEGKAGATADLTTVEVVPVPLQTPTRISEELNSNIDMPNVDAGSGLAPGVPEPVVSAERPEHAGPSEAVAPLIAPIPLRKVPAVRAVTKPADQTEQKPKPVGGAKVPIKSVSVSRELPAATTSSKPAESSSMPAATAPKSAASVDAAIPALPSSAPVDSQESSDRVPPSPPADQKPPADRNGWKATPIDRRKALTQAEKKSKE